MKINGKIIEKVIERESLIIPKKEKTHMEKVKHIKTSEVNVIPCKSFHTCNSQLLTYASQVAAHHLEMVHGHLSPCKSQKSR